MFSIRNLDGSSAIQMDDSMSCLGLRSKGTTSGGIENRVYLNGSVCPIIAIAPHSGSTTPGLIFGSDGGGLYFYAASIRITNVVYPSEYDWYWFDSFDSLPDLGSSGPRMRVRHSTSGKLLFDSRQKIMRILSVYTNSFRQYWANPGMGGPAYMEPFIYPPGRKIALVPIYMGWSSDDISDPDASVQFVFGADANGPMPGWLWTAFDTYPLWTYASDGETKLLVVDVTGY